jgi:hypothetical protein
MKTNKPTIYAIMLILVILIVALLMNSCSSESGKRIENQVSEKCVVLDQIKYTNTNNDEFFFLKIKRISDNTVHSKRIYPMDITLYDTNDTIIMHFDRRYDY